jgi:hypothetical protein
MGEGEQGIQQGQLQPPVVRRLSDLSFFLFSWTLLLWPLLLNAAPFYSPDSSSYLRGGEFGFHTGLSMIEQWWHSLIAGSAPTAATGDPNAAVAHAIAEAGGARSLIYSVSTYLLRAPGVSLLFLAIAQAGTVAFSLTMLRSLIAPRSAAAPSLMVAAAVALITPAAWYAAYVVPDILAGVAIASAATLTLFFDRIGLTLRLALVVLAAFCITVHGSHLPVALATLAAGGAANLWLQRPSFAAGLRRSLWFLSPIVIAVLALLSTSYLAFGELSLAPKRYPIQLARSVADGPGAWHLRDHCATERYAICEVFGTNPPRQVGDFLWADGGVRARATPEQMDRIRAEESTIVRRAAMEYPGHQIRRSVMNTLYQLVEFGPGDLVFGLELTDGEDPKLVNAAPDRPALKSVGQLAIYFGFIGGIGLLFAVRRKLFPVEIAAVTVVSVGLLANAAVCGILSAVTDRYQGRVAWVLPALVFIILLRVWSGSKPVATST